MIRRVWSGWWAGLLLVVVLLAACGRATGPRLRVENPWARPAKPMAMSGMEGKVNSAVYLTIVNEGDQADRLIAVKSDVAEATEVHESVREGDVMKMRPVTGGLEIPPRGRVAFKPGGYHIMLIGVTRALQPGDKVTVVLVFEKSGEMRVEAEVRE